jgi:phosphoserine phosphatase
MSDPTPRLEPGNSQPSLLALLEVARQLAAPCDLTTAFARVIEAGRSTLGAERGSVFLYDEPSRELYISVATGIEQEIRFSIEQGIAGQCARTRQIINVPDCYADPRFNQEIDRRTGYRTRSLIAVPLVGLDDELVGVMQLLNPVRGRFDAHDEKIAWALAAQAAVALQRARLIDERMVKLKLEQDLELARKIQRAVLPRSLPTVAGYDLAGYTEPADQTGGDIYDVAPMPASGSPQSEGLLLLVADATGHGVGPAISVTQARGMVRLGLRLGANLDDLCAHLNARLCEDLPISRFITVFMGRLDPQRHVLEYHSAGQAPLLHYHAADGRMEWFDATTAPMGILPELDLPVPAPMRLAPGDLVVVLTDGFYEACNVRNEDMGRERIADSVRRCAGQSAQGVLDAILQDLRTFAAGAPQRDDLTALIVKRQ